MAGVKQAAEPWLPETFEFVTEDAQILYRGRDEEERIQDVWIKNVTILGEDLSGLCFSRVKLENCNFMGCSFEKAEFSDVVFLSCNFSNCVFHDSFWRRTKVRSSKGTGAKITASSLKDVVISDCSMEYVNFDDSRLECFKVEGSDLENGNFAQCKCRQVWWSQVRLKNASFFKTPLKGMDFTTCEIKGIVLSDECSEVRGAIMDLYQAAELAGRLGVVIK